MSDGKKVTIEDISADSAADQVKGGMGKCKPHKEPKSKPGKKPKPTGGHKPTGHKPTGKHKK